MNKIGSLMVFQNLNVACFNEIGEQVPELQVSIPSLLAARMEQLGYNPQGVVIETPSGNWRLFRTEDGGWNREVCA